jgi:hypothetical protein
MAALLCAERHRQSCDFFIRERQFGFTYKSVLSVINKPELCPSRSAYSMLMLTLFVDREPYEPHNPVQFTRVLPTVSLDKLNIDPPNHVDPYAGLGVEAPTPNFADLKEAIHKILDRFTLDGGVKTRDSDSNEFICGMLNITRCLMLYGLYDGKFNPDVHNTGVILLGDEARALAKVMLPLLDGRTDVPMDNFTRFDNVWENKLVMNMKRGMIQLIDVMFALRASSRIEALLNASAPPSPPAPTHESEKEKGMTTFVNPVSVDFEAFEEEGFTSPRPVAQSFDRDSPSPVKAQKGRG